MPHLLVLASAPPSPPSDPPRAICVIAPITVAAIPPSGPPRAICVIAPITVAAIRPGVEVGSLAKTMSGPRTGDIGSWHVMVPFEGIVLGLLYIGLVGLWVLPTCALVTLHHPGLSVMRLP